MPDNELFKASLSKAMALCASREYCVRDMLDKLRSWGVGDSDCYKITDRLGKENFINEERYAKCYARDKFNYNKWGRVKISAHLKAKNISSELINNALATIDDTKYRQTIETLLASHRRSVKAKNQYDLKAKLMRYGLSKGFESSLLFDLLGETGE